MNTIVKNNLFIITSYFKLLFDVANIRINLSHSKLFSFASLAKLKDLFPTIIMLIFATESIS